MPTPITKWTPTGKGVTENIIANAIVAGIGMAGSALLAWFAAPTTRGEWVGLLLLSLITLSVAWVLAAIGWRKFYPVSPAPGLDESSDNLTAISEDAQDRLAKITWSHGRKHSSLDNPWELTIRVAFTRHAREASCYVRWGELVGYINAPPAWNWSKQTT